ncbi:bifunctional homocysteine S-methyltransferase/methylenetetrahydrofolate reductase [Clostridia bacterium]|nr:bifunctional homocysteine S-methyltransferase/methylenetetrahydrofolate reductase [Clostridia bacterium]
MNIKNILERGEVLILDGAMGTYYNLRNEKKIPVVDLAVRENPDEVRAIYREYLQAGADVLNTNTFSSNSYKLRIDHSELKLLLQAAYDLALEEALPFGKDVAADIGPLPEMVGNEEISNEKALAEYYFIIDCFLAKGCEIFNFETFSTPSYIHSLADYIKKKNPDTFIMASFAISSNGYTMRDYSAESILRDVASDKNIDSVGFNCGTGPTHLYNTLENLTFPQGYFSVVPNASYPEVIDGKIIYSQNPEYFTEIMLEMRNLGIQILGGCCGTTPDHIRLLKQAITSNIAKTEQKKEEAKPAGKIKQKKANVFAQKLERKEFVIAVELPPPSDADIKSVMNMAHRIKKAGADILTFSDSPLGRARTNSLALSAKVKREVGICTLPHLCCRDRNTIALKSDLLGAYIEELNNILLLTGDPIPQAERSEIASIFDLNSFKLIELVQAMNESVFSDNPFHVGAALNLNVRNIDKSVERMARKQALGANYFMTQPIYEQRVIEYLANENLNDDYTILAGIMPIVNYKNARFLNNEIPGIHLPDEVIAQFHKEQSREEAEQCGIAIALETIEKVKDHVSGLYLVTPLNRIGMIESIIHQVKK